MGISLYAFLWVGSRTNNQSGTILDLLTTILAEQLCWWRQATVKTCYSTLVIYQNAHINYSSKLWFKEMMYVVICNQPAVCDSTGYLILEMWKYTGP